MSNIGWIVATIFLLALGTYFLINAYPRDQANFPATFETESPDGNEK